MKKYLLQLIVLALIALGSVGYVIADEWLNETELGVGIPADILESKIKNGVAFFHYVSDEDVEAKNLKDYLPEAKNVVENINRRLPNKMVFERGGGKTTEIFFSGDVMQKKGNKWKKVKTATTTEEQFVAYENSWRKKVKDFFLGTAMADTDNFNSSNDIKIQSNAPTTNYSGSGNDELYFYGAAYDIHNVIYWDISSLPADKVIDSARATLYKKPTPASCGSFTVYSKKRNETFSHSTATWNNSANEFTETDAQSYSYGGGSANVQPYLTDMVTAWYGGETNYGAEIFNESSGECACYTSRTGTDPLLAVTYSEPVVILPPKSPALIGGGLF